MRKTGNSSLQNPATRALVLIVLVILVSVYVGTSPVRRGFLYYTGIFAPSVVAAIASGLWTWSWKWFWLMLGADHTYSNITVPVTVSPSSRRGAAGCPKLFQLASRKGVTSFNYETSLVRSRANSWSVIDPDFLSRSSFSISSATLKPTTRRSSSRACCACWLLRSAMPLDWVIMYANIAR